MFRRQKKEEDPSHRVKQAMLSAANRALEYKRTHPGASDHEAIDHVMRAVNDILSELD